MNKWEIERALSEYRPPNPFSDFSVTFRMRTQIALANPWINGDALVMYLLLNDLLGDAYYDLPRMPLDLRDLRLPLERTHEDLVPGGIHHASASLFDGEFLTNMAPDRPGIFSTTQYKRFASEQLDHLNSSKKIPLDVGYFKAMMTTTPYVHAREVKFYMRGDRQECERLLKHVTHLGKDRGRGWGEVMGMTIEELPEDRSLEYNGVAMRPLPWPMVEGRVRQQDLANIAYRTPYWVRSNTMLCAPPGCALSTKAPNDDVDWYAQAPG
ncbi:MAG TPA: hypothetical protein PLJ11_04440 [Methanomassiliicoccales archaeon]|nr:hypothetical protein [Methanomassiliicoccales archaeon]